MDHYRLFEGERCLHFQNERAFLYIDNEVSRFHTVIFIITALKISNPADLNVRGKIIKKF
jgi:hypothetical protein